MERRLSGIAQRTKEVVKRFRHPVEKRFTHEDLNVTAAVEYALKNHFGRNTTDHVSKFTGILSTNPDVAKNAVNAVSLRSLCNQFSIELGRNLVSLGLEVEIHGSSYRDRSPHTYLVVRNMLVDSTIGQFVEGYNHVFVGTRQQLKKLVVKQAGEGKQYKLQCVGLNETNEQFFERIWGSTSRRTIQLEQLPVNS